MEKKKIVLLNFVVLFAIVGIMAVLINTVFKSHKACPRKLSAKSTLRFNLRQIGIALMLYSDRYNGLFPDPRTGAALANRTGTPLEISKALNMLYCSAYIEDPRVFISPLPEKDGKIPTPGKWQKWSGDWADLAHLASENFNPDFAYSIGHKCSDDVVIVVGERLTAGGLPTTKHEGRGMYVLYADEAREKPLRFAVGAISDKTKVIIPLEVKKGAAGGPDRIFDEDVAEFPDATLDSVLVNPNLP